MTLKKSLFDLSHNLLLIISKRGKVKECNQSFAQLLGFEVSDLKGQHFLRLLHPDETLPAKMFLSAVFQSDSFTQQIIRFRNSKNEYVALNVHSKFKAENECMVQAIDLDVLSRNESDKFINQHVLSLILDLVPYPVFVKNSCSKYILLNQAQADLFGMSVSQMLGKRDDELIEDKEELQLVKQTDEKAFATLEKIVLDEQNFTTPNGRKYMLQTTKVPFINTVTSEKNILGISIDYTERKAAEEELMKTNFELDSFVYRASHDLKAPLRSIMGLLNLMKIDKSEENQENCLHRIESSIARLDDFIKDLTNYSRNARLDINKQSIDLEKTILHTLGHLKYLDPDNKINVDINIHASHELITDQHRLEVILQNLLSNAIKYQKPGNVAPHIKIEGKVGPEKVKLQIKDNGIGIEKHLHGGIFQMFYRATELSEGSGLGLYIAKQSVEKLGGNITFSSIKNGGTVFAVEFKNYLPKNKE